LLSLLFLLLKLKRPSLKRRERERRDILFKMQTGETERHLGERKREVKREGGP
jgi:hypothetical protein